MSTGRRLNWVGLVVVLVIGGLALAYFAISRRADRRLQEKLNAIRTAGAPLSITEASPKPIAPGENAAAYLQRATNIISEFDKRLNTFYESPLGKDYDERKDNGLPPTAEQLAAQKNIVDDFPEIARVIQQAANCKSYVALEDPNVPMDQYLTDCIRTAGLLRNFTRYATWRAQILASEGKVDEAVATCLPVAKLARMYGKHALLMQQLVSLALQGAVVDTLNSVLRSGPVSATTSAAVEKELAEHDNFALLVNALKTERAYNLTRFDEMAEQAPAVLGHVFAWRQKDMQSDLLDYYEQAIALAALPWHQKATVAQPSASGTFVATVAPATQANYTATNRTTAALRALRVLNALAQFKLQNGHEATGIEELGLPKDATTDPFSGQPLKLKLTPRGWLIYSVFQDGIDDGGDLSAKTLKDHGLAPPNTEVDE